MLGNGPLHPLLGASGAIMGLAGMYLILFPLHRVFCTMWISIWLWFRRIWGYKIFPMRDSGCWRFTSAMTSSWTFYRRRCSTAAAAAAWLHWRHIGGFTTGMILGLAVLFSRLFNTHGGDLLSVTLGRYAWPLIGKPNRWNAPMAAAPAARPRRPGPCISPPSGATPQRSCRMHRLPGNQIPQLRRGVASAMP